MKFAHQDGCIACATTAYDAFPALSWTSFCSAHAQSDTIRTEFNLAHAIRVGDQAQNFKVRQSVDSLNQIGIVLDKPYLALTEEDVLSSLKLPPTSFGDLRSVTLPNENNVPTQFFLFDDGSFRRVRLFSKHELTHHQHLIEASGMLRREQPFERYQILCRDEVAKRRADGESNPKGSSTSKDSLPKVLTLEEAKIKAQQIIAQREENEKKLAEKGDLSVLDKQVDNDLQEVFASIETLQPMVEYSGAAPTKAKAKAKAKVARSKPNKQATAPRQHQSSAAGGRSRSPVPSLKKSERSAPESEPVLAHDAHSQDAQDLSELAKSVKLLVGGDVKSIQNLDPYRVMNGEHLGRSLTGATWVLIKPKSKKV